MTDRGTLEKLVIRAYTQPDFSGEPVGEFQAFVNPNELTLSFEIEYDEAQAQGTTQSRMTFKKVKPGDLSVVFFLDGTGANGTVLDVQAAVTQFQAVTGYNGTIHRPNYLKIGWGTLSVRRCVLKSCSVAYKLFQPDGVPLRAVITAAFADTCDDQTRVALAQDESPDLTRLRILKGGETLPKLCNDLYGDPNLYIAVARANGLDDFRNIPPGTRLFFPPLEK